MSRRKIPLSIVSRLEKEYHKDREYLVGLIEKELLEDGRFVEYWCLPNFFTKRLPKNQEHHPTLVLRGGVLFYDDDGNIELDDKGKPKSLRQKKRELRNYLKEKTIRT